MVKAISKYFNELIFDVRWVKVLLNNDKTNFYKVKLQSVKVMDIKETGKGRGQGGVREG